jgi:SAM-dependent methyltransferase
VEIQTIEAMIAAEDSHPWYRSRLFFVNQALIGMDPQTTKILDFGCGSGAALELCVASGFENVLGLDTSDLCVRSTQLRGINVKKIGADLPILDSTYDLILCLDVLEHIEKDLDYLNHFREHLNIGGKILITVPAHQFLWSQHDENNHHFRRYNKKTLKKLIFDAQLEIKYERYWNSILFPFFVVQRSLSRLKINETRDEFSLPPKFLRQILYFMLMMEGRSVLLGKLIGVSIVAVLELPN